MRFFLACVLSLFLVMPCWAGVKFAGNGDEDSIDLPVLGTTRTAGQPLTVACWAYSSNVSAANQVCFGSRNGSSAGDLFKLVIHYNDIQFQYDPTGSGASITDFSNISADTWYHLVGIYDGNYIRIYVNGSQTAVSAEKTSAAIDQDNAYIGFGTGGTGEYLEGGITEVAIWTAALTPAEITQLANSRIKGMPLQIQAASLRGYWPLDDFPPTTGINALSFKDLSGNSNHGAGVDADGDSITEGETILTYPPPVLMGE